MAPILTLASKYGLQIIEDAAEMHGQAYKGLPCGSFGTISTFSFYPNKHVTTGEGFDAVEAMQRLAQYKIGTRPFFWCMHEQPVFQKMGLFDNVSCPVAERIARRGFYIPSGMAITQEQIERVAIAIGEIFA